VDLRALQRPLKERYRAEPGAARITLTAKGAQLTCQMVATSMGVPVEAIEVTVEGDLDLRGTLGLAKDVPAGFEAIRLRFDIQAPEATREQLDSLASKTERSCTVFQTLVQPPPVRTDWHSG
jgi:uncharacterized OsmC-like protein